MRKYMNVLQWEICVPLRKSVHTQDLFVDYSKKAIFKFERIAWMLLQMPKLLRTMEELAGNYYAVLFWVSFFNGLGSNGSLDQRHFWKHSSISYLWRGNLCPGVILAAINRYVDLDNWVLPKWCIPARITMRMWKGS